MSILKLQVYIKEASISVLSQLVVIFNYGKSHAGEKNKIKYIELFLSGRNDVMFFDDSDMTKLINPFKSHHTSNIRLED